MTEINKAVQTNQILENWTSIPVGDELDEREDGIYRSHSALLQEKFKKWQGKNVTYDFTFDPDENEVFHASKGSFWTAA